MPDTAFILGIGYRDKNKSYWGSGVEKLIMMKLWSGNENNSC